MKPSEFTTLLWGPSPPGLIHTWSLAQKRSYYHRSPHGTDMHAGQADAYIGVGLAHKDHGPSRRTRSELVIGIPGMWLDVDDDQRARARALSRIIRKPTLIVDSGHGVHAWWLFEEGPWIFANKAEQQEAAVMIAQWQKLHRAHAPELDATHDLARLMRLPGTLNGKGLAVPVEMISTQGPRWTRARLLARAREAGPVTVNLGAERAADATGGHATARGALRAGGTLGAETLALLMEMPEFAVLWNHERPEQHWSLSEYDMALTNLMAASGWTDQQLADLITAHRARYGETSKARRPDYLRRTISKARETQDREALMQRIRDRDLRRAA